jgi:hypothetical protein
MQQMRAELAAHVGQPSAVQRMLIERAATLSLQLEALDRRMFEGGTLNEHDTRIYLAWSNSLTRTLKALGVAASRVAPGDRLQQHLAARKAA